MREKASIRVRICIIEGSDREEKEDLQSKAEIDRTERTSPKKRLNRSSLKVY